MAFTQGAQPGVTRYPNLLPVQAYGYPDGTFLAMLAEEDRTTYERIVKEGVHEYNQMLLLQIQAYKDGLGVKRIADRGKRLALYLLKKPELWVKQKAIFSKRTDADWTDFTLLVADAYAGKLESAEPFDVEHMRAVWMTAALALGVIQPTALPQAQGVAA